MIYHVSLIASGVISSINHCARCAKRTPTETVVKSYVVSDVLLETKDKDVTK